MTAKAKKMGPFPKERMTETEQSCWSMNRMLMLELMKCCERYTEYLNGGGGAPEALRLQSLADELAYNETRALGVRAHRLRVEKEAKRRKRASNH